jgi:type II secretory pathway component GspD/PulD (secretin)
MDGERRPGVFQAYLRGWKRLAAGLVLAPGLTGATSEALAQSGSFAESKSTSNREQVTSTSPELEIGRSLMKQAKAAFEKKDYAKAKELAEQAKMLRIPASAWGNDRPDTMLVEIQKRTGVRSTNTTTAKKPVDPKVLVKQGREALESGKLDLAQDLARQADASRPSSKWGLFEDNPSSLLHDIQKAKVKKDKADSVRMLTEARSFLNKRTASEAERAANLEKAQLLAKEAERLHGSYSIWDLGDRPTKVISDAEAAKAKLKTTSSVRRPDFKGEPKKMVAQNSNPKTSPKGNPKEVNKPSSEIIPTGYNLSRIQPDSTTVPMNPKELTKLPSGGSSSGYNQSRVPAVFPELKPIDPIPNSNEEKVVKVPEPKLDLEPVSTLKPEMTKPDANRPDPVLVMEEKEQDAKKLGRDLMKEAHALQVRGKFVEAKIKLMEALQYSSHFSVDEESPEIAMMKLNADAHKNLDSLCKEATDIGLNGDPVALAQAEMKLKAATELAKGMGIDTEPISAARTMIAKGKGTETPKETVQLTPLPLIQNPTSSNPKNLDPMIQPPTKMEPVDQVPVIQNPSKMVPKEQIVLDPVPVVETPKTVVETPKTVVAKPGKKLLDSARTELRAGNTEAAKRLVEDVLAGDYDDQNEAQALLRTINAEETIQRQRTAMKSFETGLAAYNSKDYRQAFAIFQLIDDSMLPNTTRAQLKDLKVATTAGMKSQYPGSMDREIVQTVGQEPKILDPGSAVVGSDPRNGADSLLKQQEALQEIQFQKFRSEGLKVQSEAQAKFGKGETDSAIQQLQGYLVKVKESQLESPKVAMLSRPIESRLEQFRVMKKQQDFLTGENKERAQFRKEMTQEALARQNKEKQVSQLLRQFGDLMEQKKFREAYLAAAKAKEIDPDNTAVIAAITVARTADRSNLRKEIESEKEAYNWKQMTDGERFGPAVSAKDPIALDPDALKRGGSKRTSLSNGIGFLKAKSEKEKEIERKLNGSITLNFAGTPLPDVVDYIHTVTGMNISLDKDAIEADARDPNKLLVSDKLTDIQLKSGLNVVLKKLKLVYLIEDDVLKITTEKGVRGKLTRKVIPVTDLVIPIPNHSTDPVHSMTHMLNTAMSNSRPTLQGIGTPPTPYTPSLGLSSGTGNAVSNSSSGGRLENNQTSQSSIIKSGPIGTMEDQLIKLITSTIEPASWSDQGGPGRIDYYPIGSALVINQTPDVIEQVIQLLEALRQLQDLEVAIEIRLIALSEAFFERIGVDFDLNIKTNTSSFEPNLTQNAFRPFPFVNDISGKGVTLGLNPAGAFTPDLDIPIRATSLPLAIPPFGGFQNSPGTDGGVNFGIAFLNDIQVFMLLEAAQGDRRFNVMQAPKLTMFNGQSASLSVTDSQFFLTGVSVISVNGQIVFNPQNNPFPLGITMNLLPAISGDRRFVRINIAQTMTNLASTNVPLFPITTFVTPVFDGGFTGQPIPFTQFVQMPTFSTLTISSTVVVPDGGTVLLGGLKTLSEGRNEFGPPVLSKIPYLNRLFKNVGYGREAQSLMMMVTPRIIINREEQERATGVSDLPADQVPNQ